MKTRKEQPAMLRKLRPVVIGAAAGALCCVLVLFLFALLMAARDIPAAAVTPMAILAAAVGSFFGGMVCARLAGSRGLLFGAACGALLYLLIAIAGLSLLQDIRGWYALVKLLIVVACAAVGGVFGVNAQRRH